LNNNVTGERKELNMFKVGQRVWSVQDGFGKVFRIDVGPRDKYPVVVKPDNSESRSVDYYTLDGKFDVKDLRPTLFLDEPKDWPNPPAPPEPLPDLAVDTPVWVNFGLNGEWYARHFARWQRRYITHTTNYFCCV
jgi:hypothetical protein